MSISRIDKMIFESSHLDSLSESTERRNFILQIIVGDDTTTKSALLAHSAVSLALRTLTGPIHLYIGKTKCLEGLVSLAEELLEVERSYDKPGRVSIMTGEPDKSHTLMRLGHVEGIGLGADATGWTAGVNKIFPANTPAEAPAACFAVACVFAKIFKEVVIGKKSSWESWTFDLLKLSVNSEASIAQVPFQIDVGKIGLLGAGAIGAAFSYVMSLSGWAGKIDVIDFDRYEEPNHETTLLISRRDVLAGPKKAKCLADLISKTKNLSATASVERVTLESTTLMDQRDIFICAVDNSETRKDLDLTNAKVILNSGVGGSALDAGHVLVTKHSKNDCRLSFYYTASNVVKKVGEETSNVPVEYKQACSRFNYEAVSLAAPFVALASGALLAASCARQALAIDIHENYFKIDLFGYQQAVDTRFNKAVESRKHEEETIKNFVDCNITQTASAS